MVNVPNFVKIIIAIILPNFASVISFLYKSKIDEDDWYEKLILPSLNPPYWVFPIVWTVLLTCIGVASYLVWRDGNGFVGKARLPLVVYIIQLAINFSYVPIYFGLQSIIGGLIVMVALDIAAVGCGILFFRINRVAGCLYIPYIAWLSFASYLNITIWQLNS